ncbi:unnamed protein product [Bursaphelenchus okinawaensis]|uniref:Metalloendopeptidase n=1 Tax=Bursaphelenchus okinawaensis TaxID=465554 RepID=A0A811KMH8_9BILA|nr:unnamed protein product [Bursaphelenchus okinawaensis]CAG9106685.1 unnamed protein product [Bursaphelenchus okinawaensis]
MSVCTNRWGFNLDKRKTSTLILVAVLVHTCTASITEKDVIDKSKQSEETTLNSKDFENAPSKEEDLKRIGIKVPDDPTMGSKNEGDILMPKLKEKVFLDERTGLGRNAIRQSYRKWPNNEIPYTLSTQYGSYSRSVIAKAMNEYHTKTCVKFVPRDTKKHRDYVYIHPDDGCYSLVGRVGGRQPLSLDSGCIQTGTIVHELMHTVGFFHEQSRYDRDQFIEIVWPNVINGADDQFEKYGTNVIDQFNEPYDYSSIMHYGPYAFSANGKRTILARRNGANKMGQRVQFSEIDLRKINRLYQCDSQSMIKKPPRPQLPVQVSTTTITPITISTTTISEISTAAPTITLSVKPTPTSVKKQPSVTELSHNTETLITERNNNLSKKDDKSETNTQVPITVSHPKSRQFMLFRVPRRFRKKSVTLSSNQTDAASRFTAVGAKTKAPHLVRPRQSQQQLPLSRRPQPIQQQNLQPQSKPQPKMRPPPSPVKRPHESASTKIGDAPSGQCRCLATAISTLKSAIRFARSRVGRVRRIAQPRLSVHCVDKSAACSRIHQTSCESPLTQLLCPRVCGACSDTTFPADFNIDPAHQKPTFFPPPIFAQLASSQQIGGPEVGLNPTEAINPASPFNPQTGHTFGHQFNRPQNQFENQPVNPRFENRPAHISPNDQPIFPINSQEPEIDLGSALAFRTRHRAEGRNVNPNQQKANSNNKDDNSKTKSQESNISGSQAPNENPDITFKLDRNVLCFDVSEAEICAHVAEVQLCAVRLDCARTCGLC